MPLLTPDIEKWIREEIAAHPQNYLSREHTVILLDTIDQLRKLVADFKTILTDHSTICDQRVESLQNQIEKYREALQVAHDYFLGRPTSNVRETIEQALKEGK